MHLQFDLTPYWGILEVADYGQNENDTHEIIK